MAAPSIGDMVVREVEGAFAASEGCFVAAVAEIVWQLRHQLIVLLKVLRRKVHGRVRLTNNYRWFFIQLYRWFPSTITNHSSAIAGGH
jgi:hypothetical protein